MSRVVVVGGGQAAASLARKLRSLKFDGDIRLLCGETSLPYHRPPLSKKFLLAEDGAEHDAIYRETFYEGQGIEVSLGCWVDAIAPSAKTVSAGDETIAYDHLVLATGVSARQLPPALTGGRSGLYTLRSVDDAVHLRTELTPGRKILIVGGGYIGLELAATAMDRGLSVTVLEAAPRVLARVATPALSASVRSRHTERGVEMLEGAALAEVTGEVAATGAILSDGRRIDADLVVVGIGAEPVVDLAEKAGLAIENGIHTDDHGRTSVPGIWAAGDCASFPYRGNRIRLESVQNAIDQAETVAENILGAEKIYDPVPTFWSQQFDDMIQIVGLSPADASVVQRPGQKPGAESFWSFGPDGLVAVEVINEPKTYALARRLIGAGISPSAEVLADPSSDLKSLLRA